MTVCRRQSYEICDVSQGGSCGRTIDISYVLYSYKSASCAVRYFVGEDQCNSTCCEACAPSQGNCGPAEDAARDFSQHASAANDILFQFHSLLSLSMPTFSITAASSSLASTLFSVHLISTDRNTAVPHIPLKRRLLLRRWLLLQLALLLLHLLHLPHPRLSRPTPPHSSSLDPKVTRWNNLEGRAFGRGEQLSCLCCSQLCSLSTASLSQWRVFNEVQRAGDLALSELQLLLPGLQRGGLTESTQATQEEPRPDADCMHWAIQPEIK